jgi:hypothetical protein
MLGRRLDRVWKQPLVLAKKSMGMCQQLVDIAPSTEGETRLVKCRRVFMYEERRISLPRHSPPSTQFALSPRID